MAKPYSWPPEPHRSLAAAGLPDSVGQQPYLERMADDPQLELAREHALDALDALMAWRKGDFETLDAKLLPRQLFFTGGDPDPTRGLVQALAMIASGVLDHLDDKAGSGSAEKWLSDASLGFQGAGLGGWHPEDEG